MGSVNEFQNRWELQGKEAEQTFGLNRVNFGARVYNPTIGRWDRVDAVADAFEQYSTYNYVLNNPLLNIDPDGDSTVPVDNLVWQNFNPKNDDVLLNEVVVKASSSTGAGTQVMNPVSGWGWFDQAWSGNRAYYDGREINSSGVLLDTHKPIMGNPPDLGISRGAKLISWSTLRLSRLAKELQSGKKAIRVANRSEAEELFLRVYQSKGYRNTTGMSAKGAKDFFGKFKTYHWDDVTDNTGRLLNHSASNAHGTMKHLQIHDETGNIIRIFFK